MSSAGNQILENFRDSAEYRHAFVEEKLRMQIARQIRLIREQRELSRPALARQMGKSPSWVFRLEDPNEAPPTVTTLLDVARAYDVDIEIRFSPFSKLIHTIDGPTESFQVPSFKEEFEGEMELTETLKQEERAIASGKLIRFKDGSFLVQDKEALSTEPDLYRMPVETTSILTQVAGEAVYA